MSRSSPPPSPMESEKPPDESDGQEPGRRSRVLEAARNGGAAPRPVSWRRWISVQFAAFMRWTHIYLSMFGLAAVLFFSVTGLTLNHPDWFFAGKETVVPAKGELNPKWVKPVERLANPPADAPDPDPLEGVAKLEVVEHLRASHGIRGALANFTADDRECVVTFKGPGYAADAFIDRETGGYQLSQTFHGLIAVINDLHKGRDTGPVWSVLIDASAIVMTAVSLTGLALLFYIKRRRLAGTFIAIVGTALVVVLWYWGVP